MKSVAFAKTMYVVAITLLAFQLGMYAVQFNGSPSAWAAVILSGTALVLTLFELIRGFWAAPAAQRAGGGS
ncbi:MAG: hypothetical protein JO000_13575 [Alphaproteobacteria bacterium]|nr:hypothetical protein [Alphaproteobacteria bacterium]